MFSKNLLQYYIQKMNYESNAKLIRLYVKIKSHLFQMLDQ